MKHNSEAHELIELAAKTLWNLGHCSQDTLCRICELHTGERVEAWDKLENYVLKVDEEVRKKNEGNPKPDNNS